MVCGSLSILSSSSSFPANSNNESPFATTSTRFRSFNYSKRKPKYLKPVILKIGASLNQSVVDDGSADQFLDNNSIADFMRFRKGRRESNGELQTAVVGCRKKFPWSLLQPFLQVDLVSTIHMVDEKLMDP